MCRSSLALLSPGGPPTKSVYTACTRGLSLGPRGTRPSRKTCDTYIRTCMHAKQDERGAAGVGVGGQEGVLRRGVGIQEEPSGEVLTAHLAGVEGLRTGGVLRRILMSGVPYNKSSNRNNDNNDRQHHQNNNHNNNNTCVDGSHHHTGDGGRERPVQNSDSAVLPKAKKRNKNETC